MKSTVQRLAIALGAATVLQGCVTGTVIDANSKQPITGVDVYAYHSCLGTGCPDSSYGHLQTVQGGSFLFDAYGDAEGKDQVQLVQPGAGNESILLWFTAPNYFNTVVYHHPNYEEYTGNNGKKYQQTTVPTVYLCPFGAPDSDNDHLCDTAEASLGTDPHNRDSDGDGISDGAEILGADDIDPHYYGASPLHKDVFIYVDYYVQPMQAALNQVVQAFANAPLSNPDGKTGINLHVIMGQQIATADQQQNIVGPLNGNWSNFDTIKNKYFPARWKRFAHYVLFANQYDGGSSSGISRGIPAHDLIVTLGQWPTAYGTQLEQAGTLMHELGHNLGLQHGGNEGRNYKPNYLSIMSYRYQVVGLYKDGADGALDYSRLQLASLNEGSLNEQNGMPPTGATTTADTAHYGAKFSSGLAKGTVNGPLDFNRNNVFDTGTLVVDLDGNGATDTYNASQNDWNAIAYTGNSNGGGIIGYGAALWEGQSLMANSVQKVPPAMSYDLPISLPQTITPANMEPELDHP